MKHDANFDGRPIRLSVTTIFFFFDEAINERLKLSSVWVFFPTLEHKAFKMHSKVGDLRAQPQHDHTAKAHSMESHPKLKKINFQILL